MRKLHETFDRHQEIKQGSDRKFGLFFALVFAIIGGWPLFDPHKLHVWVIGISIAFLIISLFCPIVLRPLNFAWFCIGRLLHLIVNPLVMGFIFSVAIIPTALLFKLFRKDTLQLQFDSKVSTYWNRRRPPGPEPETMERQF